MAAGATRLEQRDVFDTRPTVDREGDRETAMDDHSVRRIPSNWRWGYLGATFTSFGVSTAMIYLLSGALYTSGLGFAPGMIGAVVTTIYTLAVSLYIIRHVINEGINSDLLSRSTFGYLGSALNSLLYAVVCGFYFAAEGSVMAHALHETVPAVPYWGWAVITSASFVALGLFGMVLLSKIQWVTLYLYFIGLAIVLWALFAGWDDRVSLENARAWWTSPEAAKPWDGWSVLEAISGYIGVLGAILAVFNMDVARFIRREERAFGGLVFVVVNTVFPVLMMYSVGVLLFAASGQPDPGVSFVRLIGTFGLIVTLVTQLRINLLNLYGGTLGLSNFSARIFGFVPGRAFWVVPFLVIATLIILTPFRENFGLVTIYISIFLCAWVSTLIGERVLVRDRPAWAEVRRGYLADWNVVGLISMWVPVAISCVMASGVFGRAGHALAVPFSIVVPFVLPSVIASVLGPEKLARAYLRRSIAVPPVELDEISCVVCSKHYHRSDFALCPFHGDGWICSSCCMAETRCNTMCGTDATPLVPVLERA